MNFTGFVEQDGKLILDHQAAFRAYVRRLAGEEVAIELHKRRARRSDRQNRAFHACITPWALSEGHNIEDLKDDILREVFGLREKVNAITGEVTHVLAEPHTSKLDTAKFAHLMERTVEIAAGCGVILELPDEYNARKQAKLRVVTRLPRHGELRDRAVLGGEPSL
jgi:hypothetical protein